MILDKINETNDLIEKKLFVMNNRVRISELKDVNERLGLLYDNIKKVLVLIKTVMPEIDGKVDINENMLTEISAIERSIQDGESTELINMYIKQLKDKFDNLDAKCSNVWKGYYLENYEDLIGTLSLLFRVIKDLDIVRIRHEISKFSSKWPISKNDIMELAVARKMADAKIEELGMDEEVKMFLSKITSGQGKVSDLSDGILKWLNKTGAGEYILLKTAME